jgi:predicted nuclease of restriction endonuclease-like (RecB) superfamily
VSRDIRGTKRIQVNSNNEIDIKSNKHQTFSLTNSNVTPNKNMPSEQSSRERRVKVDKNNRRIDSLTKKKENLSINPYEAKVKTTRKNEQVESLTPINTSKVAHKMGLTNDELKDEVNSNSHLSQS